MSVMQRSRPFSCFPRSYSLETRVPAHYQRRLRLRFRSDCPLGDQPPAQEHEHGDHNDADRLSAHETKAYVPSKRLLALPHPQPVDADLPPI